MMKSITFFVLSLLLALSIVGCTRTGTMIVPTKISKSPSLTVSLFISTSASTTLPTITPTMISNTPTSTLKPSLTPTVTPTPLDTMEGEEVDETITALLQKPGNCVAPCFWGIVPGKTTFDEADQFFYHLGISPYNSTIDGKNYASYEYELNNDFSINVLLGLQDNNVENLRVEMVTVATDGKAESEWMAYSPSKIIKQYGKPSKVTFSWSLGERTTFTINLFYDKYDLIAEYHSYHGPEPNLPVECPLEVKYDDIRLWMGNNPYYPPRGGAPLDEATSLTMDEFVSLMTGGLNNSCFNLDINAFLPHQ